VGSQVGKVSVVEFVVTEAFYAVYEDLDDDRVEVVDEMIRRLLVDHSSGWARQGRIEGERGRSWIVPMTSPVFNGALYWEYRSGEEIVLLALVVRDR
jgi:hypothetical protein